MRGGRLATVRDVARYAGVSHMTVSRVINGKAAVTSETRRLVEDAIQALSFVPNPAARALSGAEHVRIALLHCFPNPGSLGEFLVHLIDALTQAHASLTIHEVSGADDHQVVLDALEAQGVRGAILIPPLADNAALVDGLLALGVSIVAAGPNRQGSRIASVYVNDRKAARAMTRHLLELGHRRIGFVRGDTRYASAQLRLSGYRDAIEAAGLPFEHDLVAQGSYNYQSGLEAAEQLIALADRPTAIFASNDDMAGAAVAVAHRHRIDVPTELSICGFGDSPLATTIWPCLTTVRRPAVELTSAAVRLVLAQIARGAPTSTGGEESVELRHILIRRQSDGPPATVRGTAATTSVSGEDRSVKPKPSRRAAGG